MGATDRLVQFIADTHYDALPEEVVTAAKIGIMDGVANMLAGATQPLETLPDLRQLMVVLGQKSVP